MDIDFVAKEIAKVVGPNKVLTASEDLICYSYDTSTRTKALKILMRKIENTESTGAQYVTAGCPACMMQIDYGKREFSQAYDVLHPVQILAKTFS